jgi:DNA-binding transcriptional MocR family regulator
VSRAAALPALSVDPRDRRPLYVQIADDVVTRIERGELSAGERLPGVRELAARLGVGVVTASQAYDLLARRGSAVARSGRGTFVAAVPVRDELERRWEPDLGAFSRARMEAVLARLASASRPGTISLATGHPAPETFPLAEFAKCLQRTLTDDPPETMQYASGTGDPDLRETFARTLRARGVAAESPSYAPTLGIFDARGATYVELVSGDGGIRVDDVERVFAQYRPRLLYVNPFAQNPTGAVLGERRAKAIVELARRYDVVILEDQTGWSFTYDGAAPAPLASYDTDGRVVLIESLSKTIFPALRVGYVYARGGLRGPLESAKTRADSFTSTLSLSQRALWRFLNTPAYAKHLRAARALYRARRDEFALALQRALPWARVVPPAAGVTLWLPLPARLSTAAAFEACAREGVLTMPADPWYPTRSGPAALRLGFGDLDEASAREAVTRLARALT